MNWRLSQPLLLFCMFLVGVSAGADPVAEPQNQPAGNSQAANPPTGSVGDSAGSAATPSPGQAGPSGAPSTSPIPVPTDQAPPVLPQPSPIPLGEGLLISGAVDGRYRDATIGRSGQIWLNQAEIDLNRPFGYAGHPVGDIKIQVFAENPPDIPNAQEVEIGEAYVLYKLPFQTQTDSTAYVKFGQFQLPFGLLAVYDPHLQILQPLYEQSLGLRTDFGVDVSGRSYGLVNYDFALTSGTGPDRINTLPDHVVTFRLGRTFVTRNGTVNVGGSLLQGKLPITDISASNLLPYEIAPSGYVHAYRGYISKTRIGADGTITHRSLTARGEAMTGADQTSRVEGYFGEIDYAFSHRASVLGARSVWDYPADNSLTNDDAVGLTYAADTNLSFSTLYEDIYAVPPDATGRTIHRFTVQVLLRF